MRRIKIFLVLPLLTCLVWMLPAAAQTVTGKLAGTVTDPSGAVIAGATVSLTNVLTSQARSQTSDKSGNFTFTEILPGTYIVTISAPGFKRPPFPTFR